MGQIKNIKLHIVTDIKIKKKNMSTKSKIFIGGLVDGTTQRDVEKKFDVFGKIENVWLNRGFGFVQYVEMRDAEDAIKEMDGQRVNGTRVRVELAHGPLTSSRERERARESRDSYRGNWKSDIKCYKEKVSS